MQLRGRSRSLVQEEGNPAAIDQSPKEGKKEREKKKEKSSAELEHWSWGNQCKQAATLEAKVPISR